MAEHSVVVCAPLCFVFTKIGKINGSKIAKVVSDSFTPTDITKAKKILIEDVQKIHTDRPLPRLVSRRENDLQKRACKEAIDIEFLASALDRHRLLDQLPLYVTDNTDSVPTLKLEDGELRYLMNKIDKMEDTILCLQETINRLHAMFSSAMDQAHNEVQNEAVRLGLKPVVNPITDHTAAATGRMNTDSMNGFTSDVHVSHEVRNVALVDGLLHRGNWSSCELSAQESRGESESDAAAAADCDDDVDDYTLVEPKRSSKRRRIRSKLQQQECPSAPNERTVNRPSTARLVADRGNAAVSESTEPKKSFASIASAATLTTHEKSTNSRKPLMIGSQRSPVNRNNVSYSFTAAKPLLGKAVFCIDNVNLSTTETELERFVKTLSVRVLKCNEVKPRRTFRQIKENIFPTDHKTFRLCINKADTKLLLNAEKWPADIAISAWYFKSKQTVEAAAAEASVAVANTAPAVTPTAAEAAAAVTVDNLLFGQAAAAETDDHAADEHFDDAMSLSPIAGGSALTDDRLESTILCNPADA